MKPDAILFTSKPSLNGAEIEILGKPACLLAMLGKPLLQRVIEQLIELNCKTIAVILSDDAAQIKQFLGEGERWGCQFTYHYQDQYEAIGRLMKRVGISTETDCWLADATQLPNIELTAANTVFCTEQHWTGWAHLAGEWLLSQTDLPALFENLLLNDEKLIHQSTECPWQVLDAASLSHSCLHQLNGLQIGKNGFIDPSVQIIEPVYIGKYVRISANCVIGPHVVIEDGSYIDQGVSISNSVVLSDSYIGQGLDLNQHVVNGNWFSNIALGCTYPLSDPQLCCDIHHTSEHEQLYARGLRLALYPLYQLARRRIQSNHSAHISVPFPRVERIGEVQLPIAWPDHHNILAHFCRSFFPGLEAVSHGQLSLVGPSIRAIHEIQLLPDAWQRLYREQRCGLLNDSIFNPNSNTDDLYASDLLATAAQRNVSASLSLLRRYLAKVILAAV